MGSIPDEVIEFLNCPNPSSHTVVLGVYLASNRNEYQEPSWGKGWPACTADSLLTIFDVIVRKMWEP
jgi:hypothetical protein